MFNVEPQKEHAWLQQLVGEWSAVAECRMPGEAAQTSNMTERVRSIGGVWTVGEGEGEMPGGGAATTVMTLGYDPHKGRFVGTFIGSMMTHLWRYEGSLDAAGQVLTLDTEGPSMSGDGNMTSYQDIIRFESPDHRVLTSRVLLSDGTWNEFMTAHYRRQK